MSGVEEQRWIGRPWASRAVRIASYVIPFAASIAAAFVLSSMLPMAPNAAVGFLRWAGIAAVSTLVLIGTDRVTRRMLPLSTLLGLTLAFPDQAPNRFKVAIRTGTTSQLRRRLDEAARGELGDTPSEAAERLLELVGMLSVHDRLTRGHSERVRAYTQMIGEELGLSDVELDRMHWAGLLHDVGKLAIDPGILNKPGKLTDEEFDIIRSHPMEGKVLVAPLTEWLGDASRAVWEHHERIDGAGYPQGLAGDEISMAARIVSVADSYDVMTSVRSYKKPMPAAEARAELTRCAGTQFDAVVVRAFLSISLGRLRVAMGPLSWLAQLSLFPQVAAAQAAGSVAATGAAVAMGATAGAIGIAASPNSAEEVAAEPAAEEVAIDAEVAPALPGAPVTSGEARPQGVEDPSPDTDDQPTREPVDNTDVVTVTTSIPGTTTLPPITVTTTVPPQLGGVPQTTAATTPSTPATAPAAPATTVVTAPGAPATTAPTTTATTTVTATAVTTTTIAAPTTTTAPAPTTTTAPASTTTPPTTTLPPVLLDRLYLAPSGPGDTVSQPVLPLVFDAPTVDSLPNYDTDRDSVPGLQILRSEDGVASNDPAEVQRFVLDDDREIQVSGDFKVELEVAALDFVKADVAVVGGLYRCDGASCAVVATAGKEAKNVDRFRKLNLNFGPVSTAFAAHESLEIRIAVDQDSEADMWLGFGTTSMRGIVRAG